MKYFYALLLSSVWLLLPGTKALSQMAGGQPMVTVD